MSDSFTLPLILAVVSLAGTIVVTLIGAYISYYSEERKAKREANKILLKYRDPLLLAAVDLQARCYGICDMDLLEFKDKDVKGEDIYKDTLYIYTAYVVGQYLSWTWILRRQAQFVALVSSSTPKWHLFGKKKQDEMSSLMEKMERVKAAFNKDNNARRLEKPFLLFKAHQQAIGELMSCQDSKGEYYCMGFATFTQRWKNGAPENVDHKGDHKHAKVAETVAGDSMAGVNKISDQAFRAQFKSIEEGINTMYHSRMMWKQRNPDEPAWNQGSDGRLRRLQHLLLDLMDHLDETGTMINKQESSPAHSAPDCDCSLRPCHCVRGCKHCLRDRKKPWHSKTKSTDCDCAECVKPLHRRRTQTWLQDTQAANDAIAGKHAIHGAASEVSSNEEKNDAPNGKDVVLGATSEVSGDEITTSRV